MIGQDRSDRGKVERNMRKEGGREGGREGRLASKHCRNKPSICVPIREGVASLVAMWKDTACSRLRWLRIEAYIDETRRGSCKREGGREGGGHTPVTRFVHCFGSSEDQKHEILLFLIPPLPPSPTFRHSISASLLMSFQIKSSSPPSLRPISRTAAVVWESTIFLKIFWSLALCRRCCCAAVAVGVGEGAD